MNLKRRLLSTGAVVALMFAVGTSSALAHYCTPAPKPIGAGSIGEYNIDTGEWTPSGLKNGGFVTFTGTWEGNPFTYDLFLHQTLPEGALASGPEGDNHCDGRGVDSALACLGIPH